MRLRMAVECVLAIAIVLTAEWLFVRATGALQVPVPARAPAALAAQLWMLNHALAVIAMMLGAIIALVCGFGVSMVAAPRGQCWLMLFLPLPMLALLAAGLTIHTRVLSLALLVAVLAAGTYCRRFGPPGFMGGMLAFMGAFLGFFIQDYVTIGDFGWLAAEVLIGTAAILVVHFAFFRPRPVTALRRMQRSYSARARALASDVAELYAASTRSEDPGEYRRGEKRLQRQLLRLNEAALLIDAQLDSPAAVPAGWSPAALHQHLFDAEVGLSNLARFAHALARRPLPGRARALVLASLVAARDGDLAAVGEAAAGITALLAEHDPGRSGVAPEDRILLQRFATSVTGLATALSAFRLYPESRPAAGLPSELARAELAAAGFRPQALTFAGWLPGSAFVAGAASAERGGSGPSERIRLAPYARIAIQMGVAVGAAVIAGDAMSGRRFYWAVIAAFIVFMGANTAGEQLRKGFFRVVGTLVGVVAGSLLAHAVGDRVWLQILVVLVSLFLGLYLFRVNYAFMTVGITVMVSQLYVELDELSNSLLLLRLGETAVGAGVAMLTVLLVLPLHIGRVARVAARQQLEALADLADRCLERLADQASATGSDLELRAAARRVDNAYQALAATVRPLATPLVGPQAGPLSGLLATAAAGRNYTRNLLLDAVTGLPGLDPGGTVTLAAARHQLADSTAAVTTALAPARAGARADGSGADGDGAAGHGTDRRGRPGRPYVRSASLFARVADGLPGPVTSPPQLALRDLQLLDGALAEAARWAEVPVTDLDTAAPEASRR